MQSSAISRVAGTYSNDSARTGCREAGECGCLEPFDVDLDERGLAVALDQRLQRHDLDACAALPAHARKARIALHALHPFARQRRDGRRALADQELGVARARADGQRHDLDSVVAAIQPVQQAHEVGLAARSRSRARRAAASSARDCPRARRRRSTGSRAARTARRNAAAAARGTECRSTSRASVRCRKLVPWRSCAA